MLPLPLRRDGRARRTRAGCWRSRQREPGNHLRPVPRTASPSMLCMGIGVAKGLERGALGRVSGRTGQLSARLFEKVSRGRRSCTTRAPVVWGPSPLQTDAHPPWRRSPGLVMIRARRACRCPGVRRPPVAAEAAVPRVPPEDGRLIRHGLGRGLDRIVRIVSPAAGSDPGSRRRRRAGLNATGAAPVVSSARRPPVDAVAATAAGARAGSTAPAACLHDDATTARPGGKGRAGQAHRGQDNRS